VSENAALLILGIVIVADFTFLAFFLALRFPRPGLCECGHNRCFHDGARRHCHELKILTQGAWTTCPCVCFVPVKERSGDTELEQLRKITGVR
jgi:hypothetical protein